MPDYGLDPVGGVNSGQMERLAALVAAELASDTDFQADVATHVDSEVVGTGRVGEINPCEAAYGARFDGVTNDAVAVQNAINALSALGGGILACPSGTCLLASTITIPTNVEIRGTGRDATIFKRSGSNTLFRARGSASISGHTTYFGIKDCTLNGNGTSGTAFEAMYADNLVMRDVFIAGFNGYGIDLVEVWDSLIDNVVCDAVNSTTLAAISIRSSSAASGTGQSNDNSNVIRINNCRCESFKAGALYIDIGTGGLGNPNHIWISDFKAETNYVRGVPIYVDGGNHVEMDNIYVYMHSFDSGFSTPQYALRMDGLGIQGSLRDVHIGNSNATISSGVYVWNGTPMLLENIVGVYTSAPTTGKHIEMAGGGPYVLREPIVGTNATYDYYTALGVQRRPDKQFTPAAATYQVASAATISPSPSARIVEVSGSTGITAITATHSGHVITLKLLSTAQLTDGGNLKLSAAGPNTADDTITLICDGTNWYEIARSVN